MPLTCQPTTSTPRSSTAAAARKPSKQKHNDKFTITQVITALDASGGIKSIAAKKLGCDPTTLYSYAKRYWEVEETISRISDDKLDFAEASCSSTSRTTI